MQDTEHAATRDKERTRKALIDAGTQLTSEHGAGVSLADIAARAGVSKGALTHHFTSRSALEEAILSDGAQRFWDEVHAQVDLSENRPGKLLRGYIRALTSDNEVTREIFSPTFLMLIIGGEQPARKLLDEDAHAWREAFAADGIDQATSLVLRFAAEGIAASDNTPYLTASELESARTRLLELTEPPQDQ